ncbi:MAG: ABC transporter permease [Candidatus Poribacteria bacterium]|nr:ABC transporter permease [Candidatus Poribacteria bacterium]
MEIHDVVATGILHLSQNRLRAGLSILGILIGIASVLCMMAIGDGAKRLIVKDLEKLGGANQVQLWTRSTIWKRRGLVRRTTERYTLADAHAIEAECPNVLFVLPRNEVFSPHLVSSRYGSRPAPRLEGVTADYALGMHWEIQEGRFLSENDIENATQVCVLGASVASELFGNVSPIGQEVKVRFSWRLPSVRLRVVGVMKAKGRSLSSWRSLDDTICVPLTTRQQRIFRNPYVDRLILFFKKDANVYSVIDSVKEVLRKRHRGKDDFIGYWIPKGNIQRLAHTQKMIKIALGSIASFSLFVGGIGIMNMCLVSVGEKTREIGWGETGSHFLSIFDGIDMPLFLW